jgi:hypothetical protein
VYNKYEEDMAKIRGGLLRGLVGNLVLTNWKGIEVVRTAPLRSKSSWTEKQLLHRKRFRAISEYCNNYQDTLIPQIWDHAAKNGHGRNLFLKANTPAFALDGALAAVEKLHFSAGELMLPREMTAKRMESDPSKVEVTWTDDENLYSFSSSDELMIVAGNAEKFTAPIPTGVKRKLGSAVIDLPADPVNITNIWLFFRDEKKDGYSWDQWFGM